MSDREAHFLKQQVAYLTEELSVIRAENEKLRAALKPFADAAEGFRDVVSDDYPFQFGDFRLGQCRAAAAALKETGDE